MSQIQWGHGYHTGLSDGRVQGFIVGVVLAAVGTYAAVSWWKNRKDSQNNFVVQS